MQLEDGTNKKLRRIKAAYWRCIILLGRIRPNNKLTEQDLELYLRSKKHNAIFAKIIKTLEDNQIDDIEGFVFLNLRRKDLPYGSVRVLSGPKALSYYLTTAPELLKREEARIRILVTAFRSEFAITQAITTTGKIKEVFAKIKFPALFRLYIVSTYDDEKNYPTLRREAELEFGLWPALYLTTPTWKKILEAVRIGEEYFHECHRQEDDKICTSISNKNP